MIKAVFLDFDGTISDSRDIAMRALIRTFEDFGYDVDEDKFVEVLGVQALKMFKMLGVSRNKIEEVRKKFHEYYIEAVIEGKISPCVSLKPLWKMKEEGMPLIVVSNSKNDFLLASIKTLGLEGLFNQVYGAERFERKEEMLMILFKQMGILASEVIYVGDRFSDVETAKKAGCVAIAIHNKCSWSTLERVMEEKPDYVVKDFYGLRRVIEILNKKK